MENSIWIFTALGGLVLGSAASYINYIISKKIVKTKSVAGIMGVNSLRLLIDGLVLLAVFLICRQLELPYMPALITAALGLTVGGMLFLKRLSNMILDSVTDGGE